MIKRVAILIRREQSLGFCFVVYWRSLGSRWLPEQAASSNWKRKVKQNCWGRGCLFLISPFILPCFLLLRQIPGPKATCGGRGWMHLAGNLVHHWEKLRQGLKEGTWRRNHEAMLMSCSLCMSASPSPSPAHIPREWCHQPWAGPSYIN